MLFHVASSDALFSLQGGLQKERKVVLGLWVCWEGMYTICHRQFVSLTLKVVITGCKYATKSPRSSNSHSWKKNFQQASYCHSKSFCYWLTFYLLLLNFSVYSNVYQISMETFVDVYKSDISSIKGDYRFANRYWFKWVWLKTHNSVHLYVMQNTWVVTSHNSSVLPSRWVVALVVIKLKKNDYILLFENICEVLIIIHIRNGIVFKYHIWI